MTLSHAIWKVGDAPEPLPGSSVQTEAQLEEMIVAAPDMLDSQWMLIGRQVETGVGGRLDLLAIAPDGSLVLIELKRGRTPRDVVAQALDYAWFVEQLEPDRIAAIYAKFRPGGNLAADFRARFGQPLDEEALNGSHQIVVVAEGIDDSTQRIVEYLSGRDVPINILSFQVFAHGADRLLSRAWVLDPVETQANTTTPAKVREREPWNGEFYACFGQGASRSWAEAMRYGFLSAGGGSWYTNTLDLLREGERVWVKAPGHGFVGVGRVRGPKVRARDFTLTVDGMEKPALEVLTGGTYHRMDAEDEDKSEYFVPVEWLQAVPLEKAVQEVGMFGNQNTVCRPASPKWRHTVEQLKQRFPAYDDAPTGVPAAASA